ncbi:MAG: relaxase/mobilization nuclease domain-containing protein [Lachnospiraceae bacterium]|nr:relaxase/mobilization nuclease domain-containing protein [Lachnospiraceae bacterium]
MAVTKIHAIQHTVGQAVKYICNPHKTDDKVLISSFACAPETADLEFRFTLSKARDGGANKAFHLIQSFAPGEVSGEEAHRISKELADKILDGKYSYVLSTHIDKQHIHSHIIFCAANNIDYKKYHDCKKTYYHIREVSDRLCAEHGKSVIKDFKEAGKTYTEWMHTRKGDSWKSQIKKDIDECIKAALTYDDFLRRMRNKGYEINGANFGGGSAKYISFRPLGKDRFIRGRANSLGANYTKEKIWERIEGRAGLNAERMIKATHIYNAKSIRDILKTSGGNPHTFDTANGIISDDSGKGNNNSPTDYNIPTTLIDKSGEQFANNIGLSKWADKENLKRIATIYAELGNLELQPLDAIEYRLSSLQEQITTEKNKVKHLEAEILSFKEILSYARQYDETKKYNTNYCKSKDPDRYFRRRSSELNLFWIASEQLKNMGIDTNTLRLKDIEEHYHKLLSDKDSITASYKSKRENAGN